MDIPGDFGIYVHVPFCVRRCKYCAFVSSVRRPVPAMEYAQAVCAQLDATKNAGQHLTTLYFGGGTPTTLGDDALAQILECIAKRFGTAGEITLEANPEHVTAERACTWKSLGITRISLGIQSFDDAMLCILGRGHDKAQALSAIELLERAGFDEISIDLIYGAKTCCADAREVERWESELRIVRSLPVVHLSCYELTLEEHTPLWTANKRNGEVLCSEDAVLDMMACIEPLSGMTQYEVSNYSRDGYLSRHNVSCWACVPYIGVGAAAHSFFIDGASIERCANLSDIRKWMETAQAQGEFLLDFTEKLSPQTHLSERLMLAARTRFWWSPEAMTSRIGADLTPFREGLAQAEREQLIETRDGLCRTTAKGIRLNNRLAELAISN